MKIYLMRHGESTSDVENRYGGDYDDHLTEEGKEQVKGLIGKIKDKGIKLILTSPRFRARETADILSREINAGSEVVEDIRERNAYGVMTGMTKEEAKAKYPEEVEKLKDYSSMVEGAESYDHFKERIVNAFDKIAKMDYNCIGIVTHGGPIRCFFREVLKAGEIEMLADCALFELEANRNGFKLIRSDNEAKKLDY